MDLLDILRGTINTLPDGPHLNGLRSVLRHIEAAYKHFSRGQTGSDESAFTDAIYRTNQAFEGSIKEAYRVLTDKDPQKIATYQIELYLEENKVFRDRVLAQFTNYRTQWRNPSTHDHNLDFDEDESFLAIVSVSAFTKLLVDQIAQHLSYVAIQKDVETQKTVLPVDENVSEKLVDRIVTLLQEFARYNFTHLAAIPIETESQLMGALAGFLSSVAPDLETTTGRIYRTSQAHYIDMVISNDQETVVIELKRGQYRALIDQGIHQLTVYMQAANADNGILFLYSGKSADYLVETPDGAGQETKIRILRPKLKK